VSRDERDENSLLLMNIEDLNRIIQNRNGAKITYCAYGIDKKLTPREGYPKVIEPIHLMWSNGYYYLLAYNKKYRAVISMRVDRITYIEEVEIENTHRVEQFNPVQYRHEHPVMYGGDKKKIVLLCRDTGKNYIMNTIIDVFGKNARVAKATDKYVSEHLKRDAGKDRENGITWLRVTVDTTTGGVELWATQYCNDCVVVSPKNLRERVRKRLQQGNEYYC
jgi:predicted DNA-binding transcriptional regulator YafY